MKATTAAAVLSTLAAFASAQPHNHAHNHARHAVRAHQAHDKRGNVVTETEWETKWVTVTELIDVSTTQLITTHEPEPTKIKQSSDGKFIESKVSSTTSSSSSSETPETTESIPETTPEPTPTPPETTPEPTPTPPETTPEPEPTLPETTPEPEPAKPPPPIKVSVDVPAPTPTVPVEIDIPSYSGEITYFQIGLGSCGFTNTDSDPVVALSAALMGEISNGNEYCGRTLEITANGRTTTGIVADKCPECALGSIDVSSAIFLELFGSLDKGRAEVSWVFTS